MWRFFLILSISLSATYAQESDNPCDILTGNQTFAPNPRGCAMYFYCADNIPRHGRCPQPYYFDFENQSCELPEDVDCTIDNELWVRECPAVGINKVPHIYSCSEYSVCLDNQPVDRKCPNGLHYSPYEQECVSPLEANCNTDQITCAGTNPYIPKYIPNSRNCRGYYICFNNNLHTLSCGPNQVFDRNTNQCVPAGSVACEQTVDPDLEVPESLTYDCSNAINGSRIPHPEHCKFWFWCVNSRSQLFWCGKDALFDSVTRLCTEKNQAACGNINTQRLDVMDHSNQIGFNKMSEDFQFTEVQPKLRVLQKIQAVEEDKVQDEAKPEKFYGLF